MRELGIAGIVVVAIVLIFLWPLAVIWALNTLFVLGIPYTFWTWLAVLVLNATISASKVSTNKQ